MHLLIPYIHIRQHPDPTFEEFTYGDSRERARSLHAKLSRGDYVFFHTTAGGRKCITAYYVVDRILDTAVACQNEAIRRKYRNPHLLEFIAGERGCSGEPDAVLFGDPIESRVLPRPLPFDRRLASSLSLDIKFPPGRQDSQAIGSATRSWRELTDGDKSKILDAIEALAKSENRVDILRSSEEVAQTLEKDIEDRLVANPDLVGKRLKLVARQLPTESGRTELSESGRIDLLFEDTQGNLVVVEIKVGQVGRDAMRQIQGYVRDLRKSEPGKKVRGVLVCSGVMPAFADEFRKQTKVTVMIYGWRMEVRPC